MESMFREATSFNQDVSAMSVGEVTTMELMFYLATSFNSPIFTTTAKVTTMEYMFYIATSFNQDVSGMNVGAVTKMDQMFQGGSAFNQDLCAWGTAMAAAPIPTVSSMFASTGCADTSNPNLSSTPVAPLCQATCP
jgi:hypothetical protein